MLVRHLSPNPDIVLTNRSAGSRDSALTNHGYQQAIRLGLHFKTLGLTFTHLFSSHLQRAATTAGLIREAQLPPNNDVDTMRHVPNVTQLRILMEQDFGDLEGKKWTDLQPELQNKPGFVAVETKEVMGRRADAFLDEHLLPLLGETTGSDCLTVLIVSHGIFLSTLWKRILRRLPAKSITLSPDLQSTARPSLEHLGGWSNTGYLQVNMTHAEAARSSLTPIAIPSSTSEADVSRPITPGLDDTIGAADVNQVAVQGASVGTEPRRAPHEDAVKIIDLFPAAAASITLTTPRPPMSSITPGWMMTVTTINGKDHLKGLKRTGGGVGSSRHSASQKGIQDFFKRREVD